MIHYLIQLLLFQFLFLGVYELFLKKETFFSLNRIYLLVTPFLAAIIPLLEFEILQTMVPMTEVIQLPVLFISENPSQSASTASELANQSKAAFLSGVADWVFIGYLLGALISFILFFRKYSQLQHLKRAGTIEKHGKITLVHLPNNRMACTFFNTIFLGEKWSEKETKQILAHEQVHLDQKHSWDLLWFEFLRIFLWFNPFIYRYQSQLSILHEYIADEKAVQHSEKASYFQDLLNATFGTRQISFTNQFFNKSLIKKRIVMLQKPKSNRNAKLKYLLILPLMFMMLTYVSCSQDQKIMNEQENVLPTPPPPPGPPTEAYLTYLKFKKITIAAGIDFDMTFEEYQTMMKTAEKSNFSFDIGDTQNVPFSVVDQVPTFPDCKNLPDNAAKKECMSKKITELINANFDTGLAEKLGLEGTTRIQVMFKIDDTGKVVEVKARAPRPELKEEAVRVVKMLPTMIPGKQNGKVVSVLYSLPIIFQVQ